MVTYDKMWNVTTLKVVNSLMKVRASVKKINKNDIGSTKNEMGIFETLFGCSILEYTSFEHL